MLELYNFRIAGPGDSAWVRVPLQTGRTPTQNHRLELQKRAKGEDDEKEQAEVQRYASGPGLKKYRFVFKILLKSNDFERRGRSDQVARSGRD